MKPRRPINIAQETGLISLALQVYPAYIALPLQTNLGIRVQ